MRLARAQRTEAALGPSRVGTCAVQAAGPSGASGKLPPRRPAAQRREARKTRPRTSHPLCSNFAGAAWLSARGALHGEAASAPTGKTCTRVDSMNALSRDIPARAPATSATPPYFLGRGRSPSYVSIDLQMLIAHNTLRFGRLPMDLRIFQPVVYSKIDPNRCKSISIDRNVSYDTLLDAASATMLIVLSENSKNRSKSNILTEFE